MSDGRFKVSKPDQNSILEGNAGGGASYGSTDPEAGAPMSPTSQASEHASNDANYAHDLYLYTDDITERPKVSSMLKSMVNYSATISAAPADPDSKSKPKNAQMGTLVGVYLPCLQNIFGVLLFIRMSWIVGTAGVIQGFLVVFMCCCVTFLTSISMSAVATNGVIPAGGSYYMISRALGPEFGGAVGILFYLGTTVAGSMYIIGAVEILLLYIAPQIALFGDITADADLKFHNFRLYGTILLFIITCIIFGGVRLVNKFAAVALACVLVSIVAVYVGIFYNVGGNDRLKLCMLGHRVLVDDKLGNYSCSEDLKEEGSPLYAQFCHPDENNKTHCLDYFMNNNITERIGIRGLSSGAFFENLKASFVEDAGRYITDTDDPADYGNLGEDEGNYMIKADMKTSFVILVGIFFPSVTGIMAGSNRSGDLKDAQKSIPIGTLAAVCTTSTVYLSAVFLLGASIDNLLLRDKFGDTVGGKLVVANLAWPNEWVILIGSLLSTIGAGMQSLTGAPRLLQAIAKDEIIPFLRPLAVSSANGEPRRALFLTWFICQISVLIGNLDNITPLLSCFFLMCYGFVNLACALQTLLRTPNWRPRFKYYHWSMSLIGLGLCAAVMFMCSWYYALCSIGLAILIYKYIEYRGAEKEWGDGIRGIALSAARYALLRLEEGPPHTKNWRPQILIFVKMDEQLFPKHTKILTFASQLKAGKGLTMAVSVLEGDSTKKYGEQQAARESLRKAVADEKLKGFVDVLVAQNVVAGLNCLVQTCGIGGLKPNTVLMGWPHSWRKSTDEKSVRVFIQTVRTVSAAKMALLVPKGISFYPDSTEKVAGGTIDIWWIVHDGGLLMLLPFLLCQHKTWHNCKMRIFTVAQLEDNSIQMKKDLKMFLYHLRIDADVEIVEMENADISAYTYERTLMMEQRGQMVTKLKSRRDSKQNVQAVVDQHRASLTGLPGQPIHSPTKVRFAEEPPKEEEQEPDEGEEAKEEPVKETEDQPAAGVSREGSVKSTSSVKETKEFSNLLHIKPTEANVRRMHTAVRLNEVIVNKSHDAKLVVINLPSPPKSAKGDSDANYMEFLEVLTEGLDRVLLVRGGGREVITIYS